jgi:predicted helicase
VDVPPYLRADIGRGIIHLDAETTLSNVPPEAWEYRLGNRSALEWVLDQYKEKNAKDPTIRENSVPTGSRITRRTSLTSSGELRP